MSKRGASYEKLLSAWEPPAEAGDPVAVIASTFTFDADFFEEELLARFLSLETSSANSRAYCVERESRFGEVGAAVFVDRRHATRTATLAWDVLPVPVANGCCQHSKVSVLAWERAIRVIVASANLTDGSYRRNLEVFAALDLVEGGEVPRSILESVLGFMQRLALLVPAPPEGGAMRRALRLVDSIRRHGDALSLPLEWAPGTTLAVPVFLEPGSPSILDGMLGHWGNGPRPDLIEVCSPFWAAAVGGKNPVIVQLADAMAARGDRRLDIDVPGEPDANGAWVVQAPAGAFEGCEAAARRLQVAIHAVPAAQQNEHRPLHAKVQRWARDGAGELLLIGSSNATEAGLGLSQVRNIEANLCFVSDGERSTRATFNAAFPAAERVKGSVLYQQKDGVEEGSQVPLVSMFFAWVQFHRDSGQGKLAIGFSLEASEPDGWSLALANGEMLLDARGFQERGRPREITLDIRAGTIPFIIKVRWLEGGQPHSADLAVNAANEESRSDPSAIPELDLETLLDTLASGIPLWRRMLEVVSRAQTPSSGDVRAELDPHRRVDTSAFLMQRMRRISRALEGLREYLAAPVASPQSLEWRFRGPLGPAKVAKAIADSLGRPADVAFVLAELALVIGRASDTVKADGVARQVVEARFRLALDEVSSMRPALDTDPILAGYVERAFERARGGKGLGHFQPSAEDATHL